MVNLVRSVAQTRHDIEKRFSVPLKGVKNKAFSYQKGPGLIRGIFGLRFSKKYSSVFCLACTHTIKAIRHNNKIHPQIFVLMYSVAMETSTIIVKMLFFRYFPHFTVIFGALH